MRVWLLGFVLLAACGGYHSHTADAGGDGDADADADGDGGACVDEDEDGTGAGEGCPADCDDLDPELTDDCGSAANCEEGIHTTGCPCDMAVGIEACYTGPAGTGDDGECAVGLRVCEPAGWGPCEGERRPGPEVCDWVDNDCDGVVDDGVLSPCGDCNPDCGGETQTVGVGGDVGFDAGDGDNVVIEPDGSVVLDEATFGAAGLIWIANSGEGTISKVDTRTREELGRYVTDPGGAGDPSRSTVNLRGDVISANRATSTATFIQANDCPDEDRDGLADTSTGPDDVLAWGDDECVRWNLPIVGGGARGAAFDIRRELDGGVHEYAWVGAYSSGDVYEIDVEDGELTGNSVSTSPTLPYGAAMAPDGVLWVASSGSSMAKVDTTTLEVTQYAAPHGRSFYGITVDAEGYVWTSGQQGAQRFDPDTEEYELVEGGCGGGIAADTNGSVWTGHGFICNPRGVSRIDTVTLEAHVIQTGHDTHGVAVDFDGNVWAINVSGGSADVIDPEDEDWETAWTSGVFYNYTYSDMTGFQLAHGGRAVGRVSHVFEADCHIIEDCHDSASLAWDAEVGPGASITLTGRTARTLEALPLAREVPLAVLPGDAPPVDLLDALGSLDGFLRIDATLETTGQADSPVLRSLSVTSDCHCGGG